MKNFKTNLVGIVIFVLLGFYFFNLITTEQFITATGFLIGIGFFAAKDHNVTGGKDTQSILGTDRPNDRG